MAECIYIYNITFNSKKFDSELWKASEVIYATNRCPMYHDLVSNHLQNGMTQDQVEVLLGEGQLFLYCTDKKIKCINYLMDMCSLGSIDRLYACFNENNKLIYYGRERYCKPSISYYKKTNEQWCDGVEPIKEGCGLVPW